MILRRRELPVEEHRHGELLGDPVGQHERLRARLTSERRVEIDDRGDVESADVGVLAGLRVPLPRRPHDVDLLDRHGGGPKDRVAKLGRAGRRV